MITDDEIIWRQVVACNQACVDASETFLKRVHDRVGLIQHGLQGTVIDIMTAFGLLSRMEMQERCQVFENILQLCLSPKFSQSARQEIFSLPREWVLKHIEEATEPLLQNADFRDYLILLGLFEVLDHNLAVKLARRASLSEDYDIKEIGENFIISNLNCRQGTMDKS